jgi:hypothetical protein
MHQKWCKLSPKLSPFELKTADFSQSQLNAAVQEELMRHHWDTFCTQALSIAEGGNGVIVPGCVACRKLLYTNNQYLSHFALDVLPKILENFLQDKIRNTSRRI